MSREIKFRAWINGGEDHNYVMTYYLAFEEYAPINKLLNGLKEGEALMQYTGLQDLDGGNIYEGDIIQFNFRDKRGDVRTFLGKVIWDQYMWLVETKDGDQFSLNRIHHPIIFGTIHEDLNLLKQ